ncbi:unnamed protein product [Mytilus edulis]|uniref:Uncharacterized protein n=1 Tax=Mytilus edulis TaxID=6550 RepID=A0A8S3UB42_MYTED|nr:unnamed protein product [Mytilus edulis]
MGDKKITMETIQTYVRLDNEIHMMEIKNIRKSLKMKEDQLKDVQQTESQLKTHYKECQDKTKKEKADVDDLTGKGGQIQASLGKAKFDQQMSKEQAEYLEALNKEELAKKDLEGITKQIQDIQAEIKNLTPEVEKLDKLVAEQEELLSSIFKGDYGSQKENELESKMDMLVEKRNRVGVAKYKWTNGKVLLQHAVNQLAYAVKKWDELGKLDKSDTKTMYTMATESRNNLSAAVQNLQNTQKYLSNIQFPYCKEDEIKTLQKATANVLTSVIEKDFRSASDEERECSKQLRIERLRLMKESVEKDGGTCNLDAILSQLEGQEEINDKQVEQELVGLTNADDVPGSEGSSKDMPPPTPMPLKDLAPPPSEEMLFGNINKLKDQYTKEKSEFTKVQEMNKQRLDQGLQEKLAARRNRKKRVQEE